MKPTALALCVSLAALGNVATAAPDFAQVNQILTKNGCLACHGVDKKIIGPAYTEVAKKRQGEADVAALLTKHIKEGSQGVYGPIAMPPNAGISDADIKVVVDWIIAGAPH